MDGRLQRILQQIWCKIKELENGGVGGGIESVQPGSINVSIDTTDPANPSISVEDNGVQSVVQGTGVIVDNTDPRNPIVNIDSEFTDVLTEEFIVTTGAGSYNPGDTFPGGMTLAEAFKSLLTDVFEPTFPVNVEYSLSNNSNNWEVGSPQTLNLTSNFNRGQIRGNYHDDAWFANAINPRAGIITSHIIDGTTYTTSGNPQTKSISIVTPATSTQYFSTVNYQAGMQPKDSQGNDFGLPFPSGNMSASTSVIGGLRTYAGAVNSIPTTGSQIRTALLGTSVVNRGNTFNYTIGTTTPFYVIAVPVGRVLDSVITGNNENQTSLFVKSTTIVQLPDFAGVNRPYNVYVADLGDPFADPVVANVTLKKG